MKATLGKVYSKEQEYTGCRQCKRKVCDEAKCGKHDMGVIQFTSYSTKIGEDFYGLKGWGVKELKEGDTVEGEVEERVVNGQTYKTLVLPKPNLFAELSGMKKDIEDLKAQVLVLNEALFNRSDEPIPDQEPDDDIDLDEIPF